jgi:hypothetical protein
MARPKARFVVVGILGLIAVISLGTFLYAIIIESRAKRLINDIYSLRIGQSTELDARAVVKKNRSSVEEESCKENRCVFTFRTSNRWLALLRLEPNAELFASIDVDEGRVRYLFTVLARDTRAFPTSPSAGMVEERTRVDDPHQSHSGYSFPTPVGKPYLRILLTPKATEEQRRRAYTMSTRCLVKPGRGCDLPCDYLPLAWRDWEQSIGGFGSAYSSRSRCP